MRTRLGALSIRVALVALILLAVALSARQAKLLGRHFVYFPESEVARTPSDIDLDYDDVFFSTSDGVRLNGWFVPGKSEMTLLWFHGNAGNISHRLDNILLLHRRLGVNVFIFDYRGYGRSEGRASERGIYLDAEAAIEYVVSRGDVNPEKQLLLFGRSLGASVAVEMATRYQARALILESPFTSIRAMAKSAYPYLPVGILTSLIQARYDSLSKIGNVRTSLMVLHGDIDEIVPIELGRELFDAANEPKRFYAIEGAGHNDTYLIGGHDYFEALGSFVQDLKGAGT